MHKANPPNKMTSEIDCTVENFKDMSTPRVWIIAACEKRAGIGHDQDILSWERCLVKRTTSNNFVRLTANRISDNIQGTGIMTSSEE